MRTTFVASHDRATGLRTLPEIQSRGKWKTATSVQRYEKHALIAQQLEKLSPVTVQDLRSREVHLASSCKTSFGLC